MSNQNYNEEEAKETTGTGSVKLPKSVIDYYAKYRYKADDIKTCNVMGTKFDIEEKYEIIDSGNNVIKFHNGDSGSGRIWYSHCCKG